MMFHLPLCLPRSIFLSACPNITEWPFILHPFLPGMPLLHLIPLIWRSSIISLVHLPCRLRKGQIHSEQLP